MTTDIRQLAKEAGLHEMPPGLWATFGNLTSVEHESLERFAALVAAAEREECAKLVDQSQPFGRIAVTAAAIRARSFP